MPIYEYRCSACGHQQEFLQKLSDAPLTTCTACGKATFSKMLTAAGFQLKGSGWYATDFKSKPAAAPKTDAAAKTEGTAGKPAESKSESKSDSKGDSKGDSKSESKGESSSGGGHACGSGGCGACS
jgi:putative FmdB family regulatory protein